MSFPLFVVLAISTEEDLDDLEETFELDPFTIAVVLLLLIESLLPDLLFFDDFLRGDKSNKYCYMFR